MRPTTKTVRDYYMNKSNLLMLDPVTLDKAVCSLSAEEQAILEKNDQESPEFDFVVHKVFYRHNDLCAGSTIIREDGAIACSAKSAITELPISHDTYQKCYEAGYIHIEDIDKEDFAGFSFETIADLTAGILQFEALHEVIIA